MRLGYIPAIMLAGLIWLIVGSLLTVKGIFLAASLVNEPYPAFISYINSVCKNIENSILYLVLGALTIGFLKARFVFAKTVKKFVARILLTPSPLKLKNVFSVKYLILIGSMMLLGMLMKVLPIAKDVRTFIDLTVGTALINGALQYFRQAALLKTEIARKKK